MNNFQHIFLLFKISQKENLNGEIVYRIKVDGITFHEVVNETPTKFPVVNLYLSNPWEESFESYGTISNLNIMKPSKKGMKITKYFFKISSIKYLDP